MNEARTKGARKAMVVVQFQVEVVSDPQKIARVMCAWLSRPILRTCGPRHVCGTSDRTAGLFCLRDSSACGALSFPYLDARTWPCRFREYSLCGTSLIYC